MRISDWSSDVCSSDLVRSGGGGLRPRPAQQGKVAGDVAHDGVELRQSDLQRIGHEEYLLSPPGSGKRRPLTLPQGERGIRSPPLPPARGCARPWRTGRWRGWRSEEHTSELQSLMRHSYDVFC